jgi:hypothetical protein
MLLAVHGREKLSTAPTKCDYSGNVLSLKLPVFLIGFVGFDLMQRLDTDHSLFTSSIIGPLVFLFLFDRLNLLISSNYHLVI